ncbi:MAG TPA: S41 family peptidase [Gemmataceae bacterium]|jgi:carboxyl-terminal processing protease|nr:S41 family peptidase [Gemmataceae bacterium]
MRGIIAGLALSLACLPAGAANPNNGTTNNVPPHVRSQAQSYATQMVAAVNYIKLHYVRDVSKSALVEAAIQGLYETAREPLPAGLKGDLERARIDQDYEQILQSAREQLGDREELRDQRAMIISLKAIPRVLDPYCGVATPAELRRSYGDQTQHPLGLELESAFDNTPILAEDEILPRGARPRPVLRSGPYRISNVAPGSPAQRAGIKPGDLLTHIDDKPLDGPQASGLLQRLLQVGEGDGSKIIFTLTRAGQSKPLHLEVIAMPFIAETVFGINRRDDNTWNFMLDPIGKIGYIRLGFIDSSAPQEMSDALNELKASGMRGLILDLRGNPGGMVTPATEVASLFVASGDIAIIRSPGRREAPQGPFAPPPQGAPQGFEPGEQRYQADGSARAIGDFPMVVLVNQETMGGGEMIASAIQDHHRGVLVGQRTFGKGSVQNTPTNFPGGVQFKITTGMFSRPNGKPLQRLSDSKPSDDWGVRPSRGMEFPMSLEVSKRLKEWMQWQTLRPGDSREILPLDDPDNDPQRQFALRELRKMLK